MVGAWNERRIHPDLAAFSFLYRNIVFQGLTGDEINFEKYFVDQLKNFPPGYS